ncbi:MAG: ABC transporter ATP-binding protein/permease [Candidatus Cloacimonetes bacterium]|nr:ABC transporter ATP-binding protein/permease [Candidatus Cloacimonadota bacterium]
MNEEHFELTADTLQTKIYDGKLITKLIRYLKPYRLYVAISFLLLFMITAAELALPLIIKTAVDEHIVPSKNVIFFDNQEEFNDFTNRYGTVKFDIHSYDAHHYIVFSSDQRIFFDRTELTHLEERGQFATDNYFLIPNTQENSTILENSPYYVLSKENLAVSQVVLDQLERDEISILRQGSKNYLYILGMIFFILIILRLIFHYYQVYITHYAAQRAMFDLRQDAFVHLEKMPLSFFDKNPVGRLVTRVTTDIRALDELLSEGLVNMLQDILILIGIVIMMLVLNWRMALVSFTIVPFVYILVRYFKDKTRIIYREVRKRVAMLNAALAEDISGIKVIQLFNQFSNKCRQFARINQKYYEASMAQLKLFAIFRPLISISRHIAIAIILWYGGGQILRNALTLGMLMAFIRYMERFFEPVNHLSEKFNILQAAMSGAERVFDLMAKDPQEYREEKTTGMKLKGEIEFKNVWLTYNQPLGARGEEQRANDEEYGFVLRDISFKVRAGEKVALVGHTGSGKTSIINLIGEMYPFQRGEILLDSKSIKEYSIDDLRNNVGIVQQDVFLFSGTIKDNIVLNNRNLSDEDIIRIGKYVNVDRFISHLPHGYYEPVMERGATFSVGQRQLIAFARVLAYDPAIFILDEATSNIDTETEILIQDALKKVMKDRTSIIIAHRISTIQNVDRIIVLHKGKIVEEGHHNELIANKNLYYDLYQLQYA